MFTRHLRFWRRLLTLLLPAIALLLLALVVLVSLAFQGQTALRQGGFGGASQANGAPFSVPTGPATASPVGQYTGHEHPARAEWLAHLFADSRGPGCALSDPDHVLCRPAGRLRSWRLCSGRLPAAFAGRGPLGHTRDAPGRLDGSPGQQRCDWDGHGRHPSSEPHGFPRHPFLRAWWSAWSGETSSARRSWSSTRTRPGRPWRASTTWWSAPDDRRTAPRSEDGPARFADGTAYATERGPTARPKASRVSEGDPLSGSLAHALHALRAGNASARASSGLCSRGPHTVGSGRHAASAIGTLRLVAVVTAVAGPALARKEVESQCVPRTACIHSDRSPGW